MGEVKRGERQGEAKKKDADKDNVHSDSQSSTVQKKYALLWELR